MTRKEVITILYQYSLRDMTYPKEDIGAFELAIKALEQEPILDKITAEINAHKKALKTMAESDDWYAGKLRGHECDIEIIDKYRQEE